MAKLAVVFACSVVIVGCSSVSVDCAPLISDGTRCVCPEGTVQVDDWACELPDGGALERPGRPDAGVRFDADLDGDTGAADAGAPDSEALDAWVPMDVGNPDADAARFVDIGITCSLPRRVSVGHPDVVEASFSLENLGTLDSGIVTLRVQVFNEISSEWVEVEESMVASRVRADEIRSGTVEFSLPNFVLSGTNRYRCIASLEGDLNSLNNTAEDEFSIDLAPDLSLVGFSIVPSGTFRTSSAATFTIRNVGPVAVRGGWLDITVNNASGGGEMTYRGSHLEGSASAPMPGLPVGATESVVTSGWCSYAGDAYDVVAWVRPLDGTDADTGNNRRGIGTRDFSPGAECFPDE